jgi:hypothetical protein
MQMLVVRNEHGCEEPHSLSPELWLMGGLELDLRAAYRVGGHLWYVQSRLLERMSHDADPGTAKPMNEAARIHARGMQEIRERPAQRGRYRSRMVMPSLFGDTEDSAVKEGELTDEEKHLLVKAGFNNFDFTTGVVQGRNFLIDSTLFPPSTIKEKFKCVPPRLLPSC